MLDTEKFYASFVNLDHRGDRLSHMTDQLNRIGWPVVRTRGMKPHEVLEGGLITPERAGTMLRRTEGALGCHYSQVQVMKDALWANKHSVVFEDDVVFCQDFNDRWDYITNWMETHEWDITWLGASFHVPAYWHCKGGSKDARNNASAELGRDCEPTDDPRMIRTYGAFATFAYVVNVKSIQKVTDLLESIVHKSIGIDWAMILLQPQLKCLSFVPGCCKQMDNQSDIGKGITMWSGFLKLNGNTENSAYVYQENMNDFDSTKFNWS